MISQVHQQGARFEVEQPGLEPAPLWDAGNADSILPAIPQDQSP